jgi:DNA polymerase III epsilon subunit family exonuclease
MNEGQYIVLDIETTGLNYLQDEIIEICAVKLGSRQEVVEEFYSLIRIGHPLPALITRLTGIQDSDLEERGQPAEPVIRKFKDFLGTAILVGHNIDDFDMKFIRKAFENIGETLVNSTYDTLKKSKEIFRFYSYKLAAMASHLGIKGEQFHNARSDVAVTVELFKHLLRAES